MQLQGPYLSHMNLAAVQAPAENFGLNKDRNTTFDKRASFTGSSEQDKLLLTLILSLVQLLIHQFSGNTEQQNQEGEHQKTDNKAQGNNNHAAGNAANDLSGQFSSEDKNLLLNAIGTNPASGTTINQINDNDASGNLNGGDRLQLQSNAQNSEHIMTNSEVNSFINARNPVGTPTLSLSSQQNSALENRYGLNDIKLSDVSGNGNISPGDILTGTKSQGGFTVRVDIPADDEMLNLLNPGSSHTNFLAGR